MGPIIFFLFILLLIYFLYKSRPEKHDSNKLKYLKTFAGVLSSWVLTIFVVLLSGGQPEVLFVLPFFYFAILFLCSLITMIWVNDTPLKKFIYGCFVGLLGILSTLTLLVLSSIF